MVTALVRRRQPHSPAPAPPVRGREVLRRSAQPDHRERQDTLRREGQEFPDGQVGFCWVGQGTVQVEGVVLAAAVR
jgi:hypothetical protein